MNRDFIIPKLSGAQARKIMMLADVMNVVIDPVIAEKAKTELLPKEFVNDDLRPLCQFISDFDHRCAIPYDHSEMLIRKAIAATTPKDREVLIIDDFHGWGSVMGERVTPFHEKNTDRIQIVEVNKLNKKELVFNRHRYVIARLTSDEVGYEWLGKLFPQLIVYGEMSHQFSLPMAGFTGYSSTARHLGAIVYPQVVNVEMSDYNLKRRGNALLPMMGVWPGYLKKKREDDQVIRPKFTFKKPVGDDTFVECLANI